MTSEDGQTEFDVIVVGSGAGGMTAALRAHDLGLSVLVIEKSDRYGGSSAMSGGGIWIPNHGKSSTVADSYDEAFDYMRNLVELSVSDERIHAYLQTGPEMLAYLEGSTRVSYTPQDTYCDYYPDRPGGKNGGRTLDPDPYDGRKLGPEFENLREQHIQELALGRYALTMAEGRQIFSKESGWLTVMLKRMASYWLDISQRVRSKRDRRLVLGNALIGRLRHSMLERDISLWLNCGLQELIYAEGRCCGVRIFRDGRSATLHAKRGVILAAGGFEHNQAMRDEYLPQPSSTRWSAGNPSNTGDAIRAGQQLGAATDLMQHAWWGPAVRLESEPIARILFIEKSLPGLIFVTADGRRFANEAAPYQDYGPNAYGAAAAVAYAIFDNRYRQKFIFGPLVQAEFMPDKRLPKALQSGFYEKAPTAAELARRLGISPQGLEETLAEFNEYARAGEDIRFERGANLHDRYYGDKNHKPNPCLAPLEHAPFYGVPVYPGDLGTKGGLLTDVDARVLRQEGTVIEGLYAIGNCAASVMGSSYPGAGSTLGPAMTFGYRAANKLADTQWKLQTAEGVTVEFIG